MSRIRSHRYITKIYDSSDCTKYTSIQSNTLCNITKHKFYHNAVSITLQSVKFSLITSHIKKKIIIISINPITNREITIHRGILHPDKTPTLYITTAKIHKMKTFHLYKTQKSSNLKHYGFK